MALDITTKLWTLEEIKARLNELISTPADLTGQQRHTRKRLLDVATEHFSRFGYRRANIGDIASDAGLGKGTVYLHFESKQALLVACVAREKLQLLPGLEAVMALPEADRLEAHLELVLRFSLTSPLSQALLAGNRELEAALADIGTEALRDDVEHSLALLHSYVAPLVPELSEEAQRVLAVVVKAVSHLPTHLPAIERQLGMTVEEFARVYASILARGVGAHRDAPFL